MSSVSAINSSVDTAVASVKQQILLAQQNASQQKIDQSTIRPTSSDVDVRPSVDADHLGVEDITEVVEVDAPKPQEMLDKVRNVIPKLNSVMHSMNLKLRFEEFADSGRYYVRAMDMVEQKEVSRLPHDQFLKQAEVTKHFISGLFVDQGK
ncbi:hypothetical protein CMK18_20685 [Candidatus Poribacteria bacterium]|nr:hypothetical protein [Candidatus Poribacteria bacterium]